jgi:hypothetical protein
VLHPSQVDAGAYKAFRQPTLRPEDGGIAVRLAFIFTVCVPVPDPWPPAPVPRALSGVWPRRPLYYRRSRSLSSPYRAACIAFPIAAPLTRPPTLFSSSFP